MNYKTLSSILAVVVFALLWMLFVDKSFYLEKQDASAVPTPQVKLLGQQAPDGFPFEFSAPQGAQELNYYTSEVGDNFEISQIYIIGQTIDSVLSYYQRVLSDNGWQIQTLVDETDNKIFAVSRGATNSTLLISSISSSDGSSQTQVRFSVSQLKKK